jgi:hypothetical protein
MLLTYGLLLPEGKHQRPRLIESMVNRDAFPLEGPESPNRKSRKARPAALCVQTRATGLEPATTGSTVASLAPDPVLLTAFARCSSGKSRPAGGGRYFPCFTLILYHFQWFLYRILYQAPGTGLAARYLVPSPADGTSASNRVTRTRVGVLNLSSLSDGSRSVPRQVGSCRMVREVPRRDAPSRLTSNRAMPPKGMEARTTIGSRHAAT